jgi:type III pantothenate kinase
MTLLLAVDVGNTQLKLALYRGQERVASWVTVTDRRRTADEHAFLWQGLLRQEGWEFGEITAAAISCVVPPLSATLREVCQQHLHVAPLEVGPGIRTGMRILYDQPREVGADRIASAIAAYDRYGGPVIVVNFGTATTFSVVSQGGDFVGGAIAPGVGISVEALVLQAAQLRKVEIVRPPAAIARNTVAAMQSGILFGFAGQVDGMIERMRRELDADAVAVATGGYAPLIAPEARHIAHIDPFLTLDGLRLLYERNVAGEQESPRGRSKDPPA